jgi:hypothetical protein
VAGERLDAHVLQFPKGQAPTWVVWPVHRAESEVESGPGSDVSVVPAPAGREAGVRREPCEVSAGADRVLFREALGPAQQELGL